MKDNAGTSATTGKQRWRCLDCRYRTVDPDDKPRKVSQIKTSLPHSQRYVVTCAQNATPVHLPFLRSLVKYCQLNDATLVVIPLRYRNPTSQWTAAQQNMEKWHDSVEPYLVQVRQELNSNLVLVGDIKVQPTATLPLTSLESVTGARSCIIGHPRLQLRTVATPHHRLPKILATTGAVTMRNYTDSKAGKRGEFHHTFGACVVEVEDEEVFHLRQINALSNGSFIDLNYKYTEQGREHAPPAAALIMGDTHVDFVDPDVVRATFTDDDSMVNVLNPEKLVWHDLLDFYSQSHHHRSNPFLKIAKRKAGVDEVRNEVTRCIDFLVKHGDGRENVVVASNHNEGLERWLRECDWRQDPINAEFYLESALQVARSVRMTNNGTSQVDPLHYWMRKATGNRRDIKYLNRDESFTVRGIECSFHGDMGPNGARGSVINFRRIGVKSVIGHSHSPAIEEGCYQVGTSSRLKLEYNTGPSSWLNTHCVIYANGKRSLLSVINGRWRCD
jgi:hypothetical protein